MNVTRLHSTLLVAALVGSAVDAQTIDFPSSTLASPPAVAFPFYTPGGGSTGDTVRAQFLCPDAWLQGQNLAAGLVTRIGFSLAGAATYDTFVLRAGATNVTALGSDWSFSLPDQRVQRDLSNAPIAGGGTASAPQNQWVEFDLDFPFAWQPGQGIVVDLTMRIAVPGSYLGTTSGAPVVTRAVNFAYAPGALATSFSGYGVAFRIVMQPHGLVLFGAGCAAPGGVVPQLSALGSASLGGTMLLLADQTLEPAVGGFLFGTSRTEWAGGPLPFDLGGGCTGHVSPDVFVPTPITSIGGGLGSSAFALTVPSTPSLASAVLYVQWVQGDAASLASLPVTLSGAGVIVVH
jgi:hypothetical protein